MGDLRRSFLLALQRHGGGLFSCSVILKVQVPKHEGLGHKYYNLNPFGASTPIFWYLRRSGELQPASIKIL